MAATQLTGSQLKNYSVQNEDMDITTAGKAVLIKVVGGDNITLSSTGIDAGTGIVTINALTVTTATTEASNATPSIVIGAKRHTYTITALAVATTFGVPTAAIALTDDNTLVIRIKDDATARGLTWNAIFRASSDLELPTTTIISKTLYVGFKYNAVDVKWDLLALLNNI